MFETQGGMRNRTQGLPKKGSACIMNEGNLGIDGLIYLFRHLQLVLSTTLDSNTNDFPLFNINLATCLDLHV